MKVVLADYGAGNLRSVCAALARAGAEPVVTPDPAEVREAPLAVDRGRRPRRARRRGLRGRSRTRCASASLRGRPLFGICVGLQLLFEESDEGGAGLGLLAGRVRRSRRRACRTWAGTSSRSRGPRASSRGSTAKTSTSRTATPSQPDDEDLAVAQVDHAGAVVAAVEHGALAGVQFHPERSGAAGARLLENVLQWSRSA